MLSTCAKICITLALCLIIFSLVMNVFAQKHNIEKFEEYTYAEYDQVIDVFNRVLKRTPDASELSRYAGFIKSGTMTAQQLETRLRQGNESVYRDSIENSGVNNAYTEANSDQNKVLPQVPASKKIVEDTFAKVMGRVPTLVEVDRYYDMYINELNSDEDLLEAELRTTTEYGDLIKTNGKFGAVKRYDYLSEINAVYREVLNRDAFPNEINRYSPQMMSGALTEEDLAEILKENPEYNKLQTRKTDIDIVKDTYKQVMLVDASPSQTAMYFNKYVELDRDQTALISYLKTTPEYREKMSATFNPNALKGLFTNMRPSSSISEQPTEQITVENPLPTSTSTTEDLNSTETNTDRCYENKNVADFRNERNTDELMYGCERNKKMNLYTNATDDMVLLEGAEWSVPQERPPICYQPTCVASPMMDQTALLGTLLGEANETQVGSILPKFSYKEVTNA